MKFLAVIQKEGGVREERTIEAPSRFAVYEQVQHEGGTVVAFKQQASWHIPAWLLMTIGTGIKRHELVTMTKNLASMLAAGLPLARALSVIERQSSNPRLQAVAVAVSESVRRGCSFHEALAEHPAIFSALFVSMVKAGEESGSLAKSLAVVGVQMEHAEELSRKIRGAMIYPTIVVITVMVISVLMLIYVVPTLTKTFTEMRVTLPLATRTIVALSNFLVAQGIFVLAGLALMVVGGIAFFHAQAGQRTLVWVGRHLPVIGEIVRETYTARAARTLSSLLTSGVPVLTALGITREVIGTGAFATVIAEAEARVKKGDPLSSAFVEHPNLYPVMMSDMIVVGEETGKVSEMLQQIAETYEEDVSQKTKDLSTIVEPLLMLFIGIMVGVFAISMIQPIYSLSSAI